MITRCFILFFVFHTVGLNAQEKLNPLPEVLKESSALVHYDNVFISLNDSGNENALYVFNKNGALLNTCVISNVTNVDWEALTYDGEKHLYIGDIGNNANMRKDQRIYKVKIDTVVLKKETTADIIAFQYPDQKEFPPKDDNLYYDAEAIIVRNDSLFVFTKNRTSPFDGISNVYGLSTNSGEQTPKIYPNIQLKQTSWMEDSVTDACFSKGSLFLLTYSKVYELRFVNNDFQIKDEYAFDSFTQKEGLTLVDSYFYITEENEENLSDGAFLYRLKK
ncbi:MAG: hypothetical protein WED10_07505 [Brumimicrobium sp.]